MQDRGTHGAITISDEAVSQNSYSRIASSSLSFAFDAFFNFAEKTGGRTGAQVQGESLPFRKAECLIFERSPRESSRESAPLMRPLDSYVVEAVLFFARLVNYSSRYGIAQLPSRTAPITNNTENITALGATIDS